MCPSLPSGSGPPRRAPLRQCGSAVGAADGRGRGRQEQWEPRGYFSRGGVPRQQGRARHAGAAAASAGRKEWPRGSAAPARACAVRAAAASGCVPLAGGARGRVVRGGRERDVTDGWGRAPRQCGG